MRRLGVPYGIYVPAKFEKTPQFQKMLDRVVAAAGGYTIVAAQGGWQPVGGERLHEDMLLVEARGDEFIYANYVQIERAQGEYAKWLTENGEIEVMRYIGERYHMQTVKDKV